MLSADEQRAARSAGTLAADALIHDTFPDCHIGGGSSFARGWPKGHRTDWDRKGFRVERYDLDEGRTVTVTAVTWSATRRHGKELTVSLLDQLRAARREATRAAIHSFNQPGYSGDMCPAERWMLDAWRRGHWERLDQIRDEHNRLLDLAFPLAQIEREPADLLELLEALA